jgi:carboxylesterase
MTQHAHLDPSPFFLPGGPVGVMLVHGFTGAPPEMRLLADYLNAQGYTVSGPLLPGHGTRVEDMNDQKWSRWITHAEGMLADLQSRCTTVFLGGLSLGSMISLYLAAFHPELAGVMAYSPAILISDRRVWLAPLAKHFVRVLPVPSTENDLTNPVADRYLWSYSQVPVPAVHETMKLAGRLIYVLPRVAVPLLVVYSTGDRTIRSDSAQYTFDNAGSADKELVRLQNSGHCITVDTEWEFVAQKTAAWMAKHASP